MHAAPYDDLELKHIVDVNSQCFLILVCLVDGLLIYMRHVQMKPVWRLFWAR
jgi:hypothetical protein